MNLKEYTKEELEIIKSLDIKKILEANKLESATKTTSLSVYSNYIIFAIQDAYVEGYKQALGGKYDRRKEANDLKRDRRRNQKRDTRMFG